MNDDSQYDRGLSARPNPAADVGNNSDASTPFAPEDAPINVPLGAQQSLPAGQYQPDFRRSEAESSAAYAFGVTDPAESEDLRRQAQANPALAAEIEQFRAMHRAMHFAAPPVAPPPALEARLRAATQPESTARPAPVKPPVLQRSAPTPLFTVPQPTLARGSNAAALRDSTILPSANRVNPLTGKPIARSAPVTPVPPASRFATKPAGAAQKASQNLVQDPPRAGAFAANTRLAWGGALLALLLLLGTNYVWYDQVQLNNRDQLQTATLQTQAEQLQSDLANAQQDLDESRAAYDNIQATLSQSQATLATAQAELATAQSALTGSQAQLTTVQAQLSEQLDLQTTLVTLLAQAQMQTVSLAASDATTGTTAAARIVWEPETNAGMLVTMEMPPLAADQVYQLWYLRGGVPYSAGMFTVDASGKGMLELDSLTIADYDVAAITPEPMGGSPAPTGPILIVGEL